MKGRLCYIIEAKGLDAREENTEVPPISTGFDQGWRAWVGGMEASLKWVAWQWMGPEF